MDISFSAIPSIKQDSNFKDIKLLNWLELL